MMTYLDQAKPHPRRLPQGRAGNVAITFAFATLPIVGTVGFAVDYSHANSVKAAMQAALDSTALMLSKDAATAHQQPVADQSAELFQRAVHPAGSQRASRSPPPTRRAAAPRSSSTDLRKVPTSFLGVIGYQNITVNGSSTAKWGSSRLRVALALDNTGSMADDGKMTALKTATKSLLTQLQNAAGTNGDVYVSIIPFSKDVNVGFQQLQRQLDRLGRLGRRQRPRCEHDDLHDHENRQKRQIHEEVHHLDHLGARTTTTPGTAASPIAIRTTIRRSSPRRPAASSDNPARSCSRPSSMTVARWR